MSERRLEISEDEMLRRLRLLLHRKGRLSSSLIDDAPGMPSVSALVMHFGSLRAAFGRIGYATTRDCDWIDTRHLWADAVRKHAAQVAEALASMEPLSKVAAVEHTVRLNGELKLTFVVARQAKKRNLAHATHWRVYRQKKPVGALLAVLRLDAANRTIADCVLIPVSAMTKSYLRLSSVVEFPAVRVATMAELIQMLKARFGKAVSKRRH